MFPEYPISSHSEAFYQLRKCMGHHRSIVHSLDINKAQYHFGRMILGLDTEKELQAAKTGLSLKNGDLLNIKFEHYATALGGGTLAEQATRAATSYAKTLWTTLRYDATLYIQDAGVTIAD